MIKFEIPVKLIINNHLLKMHWAARAKYQDMLKTEIYCAKNLAYGDGKGFNSHMAYRCNSGRPRSKKTVKILYLTKKLQDEDNFIACLKPLIDAIRKLELIKDDSPKWMALHATQKVETKKAYKVMVEIL